MTHSIHDNKLLEALHRYARNFNWLCMAPKCKGQCINSHVLQKNGILSQISVNQHLIEVKPTSFWEVKNEGILSYKSIGINEAFTFPGFCSNHDNSIFQPIERKFIDFDNYKVQLLFSYRGLCQEIRRKQMVKLFLNQVLSRINEFNKVKNFEPFQDYRNGLDAGVRNLNFFKKEIENDLKKGTKSFVFYSQDRPYVEVCTSAPLNVKEPNEKEYTSIEDLNKDKFRRKLSTTFVNIFPYGDKSKWIIGEHMLYHSSYTDHLLEKNWKQVLTDLLILRMEYWCMSKSFLLEYIEPNMKIIKESHVHNALNFDFDLSINLNIFE